MRRVFLRGSFASALVALCLFASMVVMNVGSAHAAPIPTSGASPWSSVRPFADPNAVLTQVIVTFSTHDDNKDSDTSVSFLLQEKINAFFSEDLAREDDFANGTEFRDRSLFRFSIPLTTTNFKLSDFVNAPTYSVAMTPVGEDTWIFDLTVTLVFSDNTQFSSQINNVNLNEDHRTVSGVFGS